MPGQLASHLVRRFAAALPPGWSAEPEYPLLPATQSRRLGYVPRADLLLVAPDARRIALELEISRADPVANQAKVFLAYESGALAGDDAFLSLLSPHLQRGRRNLAALFTRHMRGLGRAAFGVSLLPGFAPEEVARLNHLSEEALAAASLPVEDELRRALEVARPQGETAHRIHFAGDVTDVMANLWRWNDELAADATRSWKSRPVQFWVVDPKEGLFAPSKFCAFVPARGAGGTPPAPVMTHALYAGLGEGDSRFDGTRARRHLLERLAFAAEPPAGRFAAAWSAWLARVEGRVALREPVTLVVPPGWW